MDAVDLALVLAIDGSASVNFTEFGLIAGGLAEALRDGQVTKGLISGSRHASLATVLLWSGAGQHEVVVEWTRLAGETDVRGFADQVENISRVVRPGLTALGEALGASLALLLAAPADATRRIVDVAGDGRSNDGVPPGPVRDRMAAAGITINGLCVLHGEPDLLSYYQREVIGGPGAFALTCPNYGAFTEAMRRKLLREIENRPIA